MGIKYHEKSINLSRNYQKGNFTNLLLLRSASPTDFIFPADNIFKG